MTAAMTAPVMDGIRAFLRWWIAELGAMVPPRVAQAMRRRHPAAVIAVHADRTEIQLSDGDQQQLLINDQSLEQLDERGWAEVRAIVTSRRTVVRLGPPFGHVVQLALPSGSWGNARRVVELQLERRSPVLPEAIRWNWSAVRDGAVVTGLIGMVRTHDLERLETLFANNQTPLPAIAVDSAHGPIAIVSGHDGSDTAERRIDRRWLIAAVAVILSVPFTSLAGLAVAKMAVRSDIAALAQEVGPKIRADAALRRDLAAVRASRPLLLRPSATTVLEKLAQALPASARLGDFTIDASGLIVAQVVGASEQQLSEALAPHFSSVQLVATPPEAVTPAAALDPAAAAGQVVTATPILGSNAPVIMAELRL